MVRSKETSGGNAMFDGRWRDTVDRGTGPAGRKLQQLGVTADVLTATGLLSATAAAVAIGTGHLHLGILLIILTGLHDLLDGPVAKASGTSSVRGAFFDSVTDRVADALLLAGVAWYLVSTHPGHLVLLPFAVLGATSLVSYQRAKAESLGIPAKGGLMERAERMILDSPGSSHPSVSQYARTHFHWANRAGCLSISPVHHRLNRLWFRNRRYFFPAQRLR